MIQAQMHALFPTAVINFKLDKPITDLELKTIKGLEYHKNQGNRTSNNNHVFDLKALSRLGDFATECLNHYVKSVIDSSAEVQAYVTQSWTNCTKGEEFHHLHSHANSYLSGVIFIESNQHDKIEFESPIYYNQMLKTYPSEFHQYNSPSWWLPAEKNSLLIFPSWLKHQVPVTNRDTDRISLAFNSFLKGKLGDSRGVTELIL